MPSNAFRRSMASLPRAVLWGSMPGTTGVGFTLASLSECYPTEIDRERTENDYPTLQKSAHTKKTQKSKEPV